MFEAATDKLQTTVKLGLTLALYQSAENEVPKCCLVLSSVQAGSEVGLLLLQLHEGLLCRGGLLRALLHHALHAS